MKKFPIIFALVFLYTSFCYSQSSDSIPIGDIKFKDGDIIFQTSTSGQSQAIQLATQSKYSHMGIITEHKGSWYVFEAVQPVKLTPLIEWINRGEESQFVVKRLKQHEKLLGKEQLLKMKAAGESFLGKDYDYQFRWSDDKIYCSELVWKIYKQAVGIELGKLEQLGDFDLTSPAVKTKMNERYGKRIPINELVISPESIFKSELLTDIYQNGNKDQKLPGGKQTSF